MKGRGIYYADQPDRRKPQFLFHNFASGKAIRIATPQNDVYWGFSVDPDEKWILSTQGGGAGGSDLVLVENFH